MARGNSDRSMCFGGMLAISIILNLLHLSSTRSVESEIRSRRSYGSPGTSGVAEDEQPPDISASEGPPGTVAAAQGPPGYESSQHRGPAEQESSDDPFDKSAPPGRKGKTTNEPGYKNAGPPSPKAQAYSRSTGSEEVLSSAELNRFPEGPHQAQPSHTRGGDNGPPGSPSSNAVSAGSPGLSSAQGPPGSHGFSEHGPPGTAAERNKRDGPPGTAAQQAGAPGPGSQGNPMVAEYYRAPTRPLGIREPDTNLTIDQIITNVMGGPQALRVSSLVGENGTILAELDMRLTIDQYLTLYEHNHGDTVYQSLSRDKRRDKRHAIASLALRWLNALIPYEFIYSDFNEQEVAMIKASMDEWEDVTCLRFAPARPWHYNKIRFQQGEGCSSQVGMVGGAQAIYLDQAGCRWRGLFLHEIAHSIGLVHEHQLPDRDNHIFIQWDKVDPVMKEWFKKYDRDRVNSYGVEYDLSSVMHYGVTAFSKDGKTKTIKVLDPAMEGKVGLVRRKELSHSDKHVVNLMYKCGEHCPPDIQCVDGAYLDKHCRCVCADKNANNQCYVSGGAPDEEVDDEDCDDTFTGDECKRWSEYGECYLNPTWMSLNCKKSCGKCGKTNETDDIGCDDSNVKCPEWEKIGECTNNHYWMLHHCPKSCGRCGTAECVNPHGDDKMCDFWASSGECESNRGWMVEKCRKSCDECAIPGQCTNLHFNDTHCRRWAGQSECKNNPDWMGQNCQKSCGLCEDSIRNGTTVGITCVNAAGEDKCVEWAAKGECTANAAWMMTNCRKSCTKCLFVDIDDEDECLNKFVDDDQCDSWARSGECDRNAVWMRDLCTKSCKRCKKHMESDCINFYLDEEKCKDWQKEGECLTNAVWMAANCNRSCSQCKEERVCLNVFSDSKQCDDWAKIGECYANREWMIDNCYVACTDCDGGNRTRGRSCVNRKGDDEKCDLWADLGECTHNRDWMMSKCYRSCSECDGISREGLFTCTIKFKDEVLCWNWARNGHCDSNRIWMMKNCRAACKDCGKTGPSTSPPVETTTTPAPRTTITTTTTTATTTRTTRPEPDCEDLYYDQRMCRVWAAGEQCEKNPTWMGNNCRRSCGKCSLLTTRMPVVVDPDEGDYVVDGGSGSEETEVDVDSRPDCKDNNAGCNGWATHGQCQSNPGFMYIDCKRSCGMCDPANCVDKNRLCPIWSKTRGYCTINHRYMLPNCAKSCGVCS